MLSTVVLLLLALQESAAFATNADTPQCDWAKEDYLLSVEGMTCVARIPEPSDLLWYTTQFGTCSHFASSANGLLFTFDQSATASYTNVPYQKVFRPASTIVNSDMDRYENKSVSVLLLKEGGVQMYVGSVRSQDNTKGLLHGKRITEEDSTESDEVHDIPCVVNEVKKVSGQSASGFGMCTYDGKGGLSIDVINSLVYSGNGYYTDLDLSIFKNVNAAVYDVNQDYEVFKISEASASVVAGHSYYSTRSDTWTIDSGTPVAKKEYCSFFVDAFNWIDAVNDPNVINTAQALLTWGLRPLGAALRG